MKILELTNFSAGGCGVFARVIKESEMLTKQGHNVKIFSTNFVKGTDNIAPGIDKIGNVPIRRFSAKKLGGESYMKWDWKALKKEIISFKPEVIIVHSYRHPHTLFGLRIGKKIGAKVFLVTHAPFVQNKSTRSFASSLAIKYYDSKIGPSKFLNLFDKIIAITKWEMPYLYKLGVKKKKIVLIPNGIPNEFFKIKERVKEEHKILFLGRISPIKDIDILIKAMKLIEDKEIVLEIVGQKEPIYFNYLTNIIKSFKLEDRIRFVDPIYDLNKKIDKIDSCKILVLPSKSEAMPQSLIEAMSRGKIVITSNNPGSKEIVSDGKNGYLFEIGDAPELAKKIDVALENKNTKMKRNAKYSVKQFNWNSLILKLDSVLYH